MPRGKSVIEQYLENPNDFLVRPVTRTATIGTAAGELLSLNPNRVGYRVINRDTVDAAWAFEPNVTFANGDLLVQGGGFIAAKIIEDGDVTTFPVYAIGNAATVAVRITEFIATRRV